MLKVCTHSRTVVLDGAEVALTKLEFDVLAELAAHPNCVVDSKALLRKVWDSGWVGDLATIHVHICRLRQKLGETPSRPRYIHTVRGVGFRFHPDPVEDTAQMLTADETGIVYDRHGNAHAVHLVVDRDRHIRWIDDKVVGLLGWSPGDLEGVSLFHLIHPDDMSEVKEHQRRMDQAEQARLTLRICAAAGNHVWLDALVRPLFDLEGNLSVFLGAWMPSDRNASGAADSRASREAAK